MRSPKALTLLNRITVQNVFEIRKEKKMKTAIRVTVLVFALLFAVSVKSSMAAGEALVPVELEVPRVAGVAVGFLPDYEGSDDYTFGIAPAFRYTFQKQERYIQLLANELSFNLLNSPNFRFGPVFTYHFGRNN